MVIFKLNGKHMFFEIDVLLSREKLDFGLDFSNAVNIPKFFLERQALFRRQTLRS